MGGWSGAATKACWPRWRNEGLRPPRQRRRGAGCRCHRRRHPGRGGSARRGGADHPQRQPRDGLAGAAGRGGNRGRPNGHRSDDAGRCSRAVRRTVAPPEIAGAGGRSALDAGADPADLCPRRGDRPPFAGRLPRAGWPCRAGPRQGHDPGRDRGRGDRKRPARPGRGGLSHRHQVENRLGGAGRPEIHRLQRR